MSAKLATLFLDSASEACRLFFSKEMGKQPNDFELIRGPSNYPPATERINMIIRRLKNLRDKGTEVVFTAHEDIQKVYARGGMITPKGQMAQEPIAIKGWPDMPGNRTPDEVCRAADNVMRVRYLNGKPVLVARREPLGGGGDYWEVKDRFNAPSVNGGMLPFSYELLKALLEKQVPLLWNPAYIWILYGPFGIGKTRFSLTCPRPLLLLDLDRGTKSITHDVEEIRRKEGPEAYRIESFDVEDANEYPRFIKLLNECF